MTVAVSGADRIFTITFSPDIGDASLIQQSTATNLGIQAVETTKGFSSGKVQLIIEDLPSNLINVNDTAANVNF